MSVYQYPTINRIIPDVPKNGYRHGVGEYEGVVVHFTDNYTSTVNGEIAYMTSNWRNAFVHGFVSGSNFYQTADTNYSCWGCGPVGNPRFVQFEICVSHTQEDFNQTIDVAAEKAARFLAAKKLGVKKASEVGAAGTLWAHYDVSHILGGSDHEDPIDYFAKWGLTWNAFCAKVETYYNGILGINQPAPVKTHLPLPTGIIRQGNKGDNVKQLQTALNSIGYPCTADGDFGPKTKAALVAFQKNVSISADGIYGPTTRAYMLKYV